MTSTKPKHRKRYSITITTPLSLELKANHLPLYTPPLPDICEALTTALSSNFENVDVCVKKCPDLSEYVNLTDHGICGNCRLVEVGGIPYLFNPKWQKTTYEIPDIVNACGMTNGQAMVVGGGQAATAMLGQNGLVIVNTKVPSGPRHSKCVKLNETVSPAPEEADSKNDNIQTETENADENNNNNEEEESNLNLIKSLHVENYPSDEHGCCSNLFLSDGKAGEDIVYIKVSVRTGDLNFPQVIQTALQSVNGCENASQIGVGGIIKVTKGKIRGSIQTNFIACDYKNNTKIAKEFHQQFDCDDENQLMFSCIMSGDPSADSNKNMHLTLESTHFHSLTKNCSEAGKYICDITPETVEYEAFFSVAQSIYRVEDAFYNMSLNTNK